MPSHLGKRRANWYAPGMKNILFAAALASLAACGSKKPTETPTTPPVTAEQPPAPTPAPPPAPTPKPHPQYGTFGFDKAGMDTSVSPGNSFYEYANGNWLKTTKIPEDKSNYGMFTVLSDLSDERTKEIIEHASGEPGSDGQHITDYYKTFMDEAAIEAKGIEPIKEELDAINAIKDTAGLTHQFAADARLFETTPFFTVVVQDDKEPETHIANIAQGGRLA